MTCRFISSSDKFYVRERWQGILIDFTHFPKKFYVTKFTINLLPCFAEYRKLKEVNYIAYRNSQFRKCRLKSSYSYENTFAQLLRRRRRLFSNYPFCTFFRDVLQNKTGKHSCWVLCKIQNQTTIFYSRISLSTPFIPPTPSPISQGGGIWEALKIFKVPVRQGGGNKREEGKGPGWGSAHGGAVRFQLHHARHSLHDKADHSSLENYKWWIC